MEAALAHIARLSIVEAAPRLPSASDTLRPSKLNGMGALPTPNPSQPDVIIAGAGIIGLSLALELHHRGLHVLVLDRAAAMAEASTAAAGMLAVNDPDNPPALLPLSQFSAALYPGYLDRIASLSGHLIPFQTHTTLQQDGPAPTLTTDQLEYHLAGHIPAGLSFAAIPEHSLDPRQLAPALLAAIHAARISLLEHTPILTTHAHTSIKVQTTTGILTAPYFVDCTGAWSQLVSDPSSSTVFPLKGQMLSVAPVSNPLTVTIRTHQIYLVPRTTGPDAGRIVIGATVEDAGFSKSTDPASIYDLHRRAVELFPPLAAAPILEQWAGLRPATRDRLPLLGQHPTHPRHLFATGHFRNGILLAPATAHLLADLLTGVPPSISLDPFSPARLLATSTLR